jgi:hypothetical protein
MHYHKHICMEICESEKVWLHLVRFDVVTAHPPMCTHIKVYSSREEPEYNMSKRRIFSGNNGGMWLSVFSKKIVESHATECSFSLQRHASAVITKPEQQSL